MDKALYIFTQGFLKKQRNGGKIKYSALAKRLHQKYAFGQIDLGQTWLTFSFNDRIKLSEEIKNVLAVDIMFDDYPITQDRISNANNNLLEKENSYAVSHDFILLNSLSSLKINQQTHPVSPLTSLGIYLKADEIHSIEHKTIVMVENLAVMAHLSALNFSAVHSTGIDLTDALFLYRGDIKAQQTTHKSYQFFRRFKQSHHLVCFSDVDPMGIEIALTSHAQYWLTIANQYDLKQTVNALDGCEQEWFKQGASIKFLQGYLQKKQVEKELITNRKQLTWQSIFESLLQTRKTLKQEHIIAHKLALTLLEL